ncbi:hypothetical protein M9434_004395 [Picochlorum sp. BPE23]|nr:hypothetical protein M9434_004395 [Picochlorum sp. BPE23]
MDLSGRRLKRGTRSYRSSSMQRFVLPSKMTQIPFEPSRTVVVSLATYKHMEDPEGHPRDHEHVFDRMMTYLFSGMMTKFPSLHSEKHRSLLGIPMLRPDSSIIHVWTGVITFIDLTYTAFLVPLSIAFDDIVQGTSLSWLTITDIVGTSFYLVDMVVEFHTGFIAAYDIRRQLVMRRGFIAENYMRRGGFVIDTLSILSVVPELVGALIDNASGQLYKILFFFRLLRLLRVVRLLGGASGISFLASPISTPVMRVINTATFFLLNIIFTMFVFINLIGCIWWFVAVIEGLPNSWVAEAGVSFDLETASAPSQYVTSVYFAMTVITTVGFGDITPQTTAEMIVVTIFMGCAVFYFGYIVNAVAQLTTMVSSKARGTQVVREKLEEIDIWASARHIPESLKQQVKTYYLEVWAPHFGAHLDDAGHFKELPVALRAELVLSLAGEALQNSHMLSSLDDDLMEFLATLGVPHPVIAGHDLFREGQPSDSFWVLQEGEMAVLRGIKQIGVITGPAVLGQAAIFAGMLTDCENRMHTIRASTNCTLWEFPGISFGQVLRYRPKALVRIALRYRESLMHLQRKYGTQLPHRIARMIDELGNIAHQVSSQQSFVTSSGKTVHIHEEAIDKGHEDTFHFPESAESGSSYKDLRDIEKQNTIIYHARKFAGEIDENDEAQNEVAIRINNDLVGQDSTGSETQ